MKTIDAYYHLELFEIQAENLTNVSWDIRNNMVLLRNLLNTGESSNIGVFPDLIDAGWVQLEDLEAKIQHLKEGLTRLKDHFKEK